MEKKCIDCKYSRQCVTVKQINPECCLKDRENEKKDVIKEILEETKRQVDYSNYKEHYHLNDYFEVEHIAKLLDYITNLQEELEEEKRIEQEDLKTINNLEERIGTTKIEISELMSRYFYEKDFCIEDFHLDKLLKKLDGEDKE